MPHLPRHGRCNSCHPPPPPDSRVPARACRCSMMRYYKTERDALLDPRGVVDVRGCTVEVRAARAGRRASAPTRSHGGVALLADAATLVVAVPACCHHQEPADLSSAPLSSGACGRPVVLVARSLRRSGGATSFSASWSLAATSCCACPPTTAPLRSSGSRRWRRRACTMVPTGWGARAAGGRGGAGAGARTQGCRRGGELLAEAARAGVSPALAA